MIRTTSRTFLGDIGPRYWFIDEITSVRGDWPSVIKNLRDNDAGFRTDTVVLTGSSAGQLHEARKALAGRRGHVTHADRTLLPMSFTDFVAAAGLSVDAGPPLAVRDLEQPAVRDRVFEVLPHLADLVALWEAYLWVGGFPQAVTGWRTAGSPERPFLDAVWDVIHGEAIKTERLAAAQTLTLLSSLARNLCSPLNVADLARDLGIAQSTAADRLTDLADHFLAWPCYRAQGGTIRPAAQRKWYFIDPIVARLAALRRGGTGPDFTQLSEEQIVALLLGS